MKIQSGIFPKNSSDSCATYEIYTGSGLQISIISIGASIQKIAFIDDGAPKPVTLGFDSLRAYTSRDTYAGATLAPNAGRIRNSEITIEDTQIKLIPNDGKNQIHGGDGNLSSMEWKLEYIEENPETAVLEFSASLADGVDGYPGNRTFFTKYTVSDAGWITIDYRAVTDKPTYINMSNHTYWNMSSDFSADARTQTLMINADRFCVNDEEYLPANIIPVAGTPFDFREPVQPAERIQSASKLPDSDFFASQIDYSRGYNHAFLLNKGNDSETSRTKEESTGLIHACSLQDPISKRTLDMYTDAMCVVLYSGGFLPENTAVYDHDTCHPSCAIALEAQTVPDVIHLLPEDYRVTTGEKPFTRTIQFHIHR